MSGSSRDKNLGRLTVLGDGSATSTLSDNLLTDQEKREADAASGANVKPVEIDIHEDGLGKQGTITYYDAESPDRGDVDPFEGWVDLEKARSGDIHEGEQQEVTYNSINDDESHRNCLDYFSYTQLTRLITGQTKKIITPRTFIIYSFAAIGTVGAAPLSYKAGEEVAGKNIYGVCLGLTFAAFSYPAFIVLVSAVFKKMYRDYQSAKASKVVNDSQEFQNSSASFVAKLPAWLENFVVALLSLSAAVQFASATEAVLSGKDESFVRSRNSEDFPAFFISLVFSYVAMAAVNFAGNVKTKRRLDKYWYDYRHPEVAAKRKKIKQYLRGFKLVVLKAHEKEELVQWTNSCVGLSVNKEGSPGEADSASKAVVPVSGKKFIATEVVKCAVNLLEEDAAQSEQARKNPCEKIVGLIGALMGAAAGYAYYAMSYQAIERYGGEEAAKSGWTFGFALFACAGHAMITAIPLEMWAMAVYHRCTNENYRSSYSSTRTRMRERAAWASIIYGASATIPILYLTHLFIEQSGINPWFNLFLIPIFFGPWALRSESLKQELNSCISFNREASSTSGSRKVLKDRLQSMIDGTLEQVEYAEEKIISSLFLPLKQRAGMLVQREEEVNTPGSTGSTNSRTALYPSSY